MLKEIQLMLDPILMQIQEIKAICHSSTEALRKDLDKVKREKCLIISGLTEKGKESADERVKLVKELFTKHMKVEGVLIDDVFRLGKSGGATADKPRLMLVKLVCGVDIQRVLAGKKQLKGKVFVSRDLSKEDRLRDKKLREKFKSMKEADKLLTMSIDFRGRLKVWKNNAIIQTYFYNKDTDTVNPI